MTENAAPRILVVDDNPTNLRLASFTLVKSGYAVQTAADAEEAMLVLGGPSPPQLLLVDIQLPGIDGLELTRRLRADPTFATLRIVALTAFAMQGDEDRARAAGCDGYLTKPVPPSELRRVVAEHLANRRPEDS